MQDVSITLIVLIGIVFGTWVKYDGESERPVVVTPKGTIRGVHMTSAYNRTIFGFKGIRYAKPPVGDLRFRAPVPADPWLETWDAGNDGSQCPQTSGDEIVGAEDCLYINVFTPQIPGINCEILLPVMIFYHGGAWIEGSNNSTVFGPEFLLDKDLILVTVNSRLSVFGFLSTGDEAALGNFGLKDQVLALEWSHDNIESFCGDPDKITLAGQSVGAVTVEFLSRNNRTSGLVQRYISMSGSASNSFAQQPIISYVQRAFQFGKYVDCETENSTELVNCLRNRSVSELLTKQSQLYVWKNDPLFLWTLTVEPDVEGALITERGTDIFENGQKPNKPGMTGVMANDGFPVMSSFYSDTLGFEYFLQNFDYLAPYLLYYYNQNVDVHAITSAIKDHYYGNNFTQNATIELQNTLDLASDYIFNWPAKRTLDLKSKSGIGPNYFYTFQYMGQYSHSFGYPVEGSEGTVGAVHTDELIYLFPQHRSQFGAASEELTANDQIIKDIMVDLWSSFAIDGIPTLSELYDAVVWEPYSSQYNYLQIGKNSDPSLFQKYDFLEERMEFWKNLSAAASLD